ncbi:TetR/AcrR family transcriptional regulator [Paenibacillus taiwanensis]|uniref:TetR/AcrR family transcriptional regulator n=1 Tax=Paenibacillus taiwanensis TaxID=401638 RepID=UPI00041E4258|nr:TetR/AcrR family transcriptional regulator [Paenibacillus taiwanensis]
MTDPSNGLLPDKMTTILLSATKLFASKGYVQTTMQEVAKYCKISKGSIYQHYSSKDELLLHIFKYYDNLFVAQLQEAEQSYSTQNRLLGVIVAHLSMCKHYPEFFTMQTRENVSYASEEMQHFIAQINDRNLQLLLDTIVVNYGQAALMYRFELGLMLSGMISSFMGLFVLEHAKLSVEQSAQAISQAMDHVVDGMVTQRAVPLFTEGTFQHSHTSQQHHPVHPLTLTSQLREYVKQSTLNVEEKEVVMESIQVLEFELLAVQPRKVIITGMLRNLESVAAIQSIYKQLEAALRDTLLI